jgi:hypothetical protein
MSEGRVSPNESKTILQVGSRRIAVEKTPLQPPPRFSQQVISQPSANCLLLREEPGGRLKWVTTWIGWAFSVTACCAGLAPNNETPIILWVAFCVLALIPVFTWIAAIAALFEVMFTHSTRYLFDHNEGRMKFFHESGNLETRLLTDILAIQVMLCDSGYDDMGQRYEQYQLNLVFDEPYGPRLNLIDTYELALVRQSGEKLADFLEVTLVDQTQMEDPLPAEE